MSAGRGETMKKEREWGNGKKKKVPQGQERFVTTDAGDEIHGKINLSPNCS